ncbi:uncharacterized protein LOC114747650 isoform X2 [Neltuma alba]|uniref:uncharacterized protein LOC114747650 isoform X2 n=1 Tax=Neltuma alba TaxID=207710 RepID=UPI0010A37208|nr:uncharacterized protein LOC114747650 isoform X2 [Prosopis alba]
MERRLDKEGKGGSVMLQKKLAETRRKSQPVPDLSDFMTDMFFGTVDKDKKSYDLTGGAGGGSVLSENDDDVGFDDSTRSNSSRMTEEWLEEARHVVAASPTRCDSPRRLVGSPRFAATAQGTPPAAFRFLDRRDPLSRSARRNRAGEGFGGEILSKTAKHSRNKSDTLFTTKPSSSFEDDGSPATAVHRWFSNILKPSNPTISSDPCSAPEPSRSSSPFPPRRSFHRKSRFQTDPSVPPPQADQVLSRRTFRTFAPSPEPSTLSPPKNVVEPAVGRTFSSPNSLPLSPPRNPVQSAHRRMLLSSTCSLEKIAPGTDAYGRSKKGERTVDHSLNRFLEEQRILIQKVMNMELNAKTTIVLSGPSNSIASMVAAICYAWLLWYRQREKDDGGDNVVVPVMNVRRSSMLKLRQAAWLFFHAGLDATSLLFADEVDLEDRMVSGRLTIHVVGQDILSATGEVGSMCTILTDNYCEDAYDLLRDPVLQNLLLSGILLDTQNLKASASSSMTRDSEAVQLLLVGSAPNYRFTLFDQLMQDQNACSFIEALHQNYGKPSDGSDQDCEGNTEQRVRERKLAIVSDHEVVIPNPEKNSTDTRGATTNKVSPQPAKLISPPVESPTPAPARTEKEASREKSKFFLARWFGFGSK